MSRTNTTSPTTHDAATRGAQGAIDARARTVQQGANARITAEVLTWPGVEAGNGSRGEWSFKVGRHEIGHLHGDTLAHFFIPKALWRELYADGRIDYHSVFPGKEGPAARRIASPDDERDVVAILRLSYNRRMERAEPRT